MTEPSDIVDWVSEKVRLSPSAGAGPFRLSVLQRALVEALKDPAVKVCVLTVGQMRQADRRRERALMMEGAFLHGHDVMLVEPTRDQAVEAAAGL